MEKILITGAAGTIAGATLQHLAPTGVAIRALVHSESSAAALRQLGAEVIVGDLLDAPRLVPAFAGVTRVFLITPVSLQAVEMTQNAIATAQQGSRPHIVLISSNVPEPVLETEVGRQRVAIEDALKNSGLPFTIIRPTLFMQNTLMAAPTVAAAGSVYMPFADGRLGMLDARDVGAVAAKILTTDGHEGKTYTLTGPASISFNDIANTLTTVLGKEVTYVNVPSAAAKEALLGMGMPNWLADMYLGMFHNFSQNGADFTTGDVQKIMARPPISYQQFAQDFAGAFASA